MAKHQTRKSVSMNRRVYAVLQEIGDQTGRSISEIVESALRAAYPDKIPDAAELAASWNGYTLDDYRAARAERLRPKPVPVVTNLNDFPIQPLAVEEPPQEDPVEQQRRMEEARKQIDQARAEAVKELDRVDEVEHPCRREGCSVIGLHDVEECRRLRAQHKIRAHNRASEGLDG